MSNNYNKVRVERFRKAYPELNYYTDAQILRVLNQDKSSRRELEKRFIKRVLQEVLQPL